MTRKTLISLYFIYFYLIIVLLIYRIKCENNVNKEPEENTEKHLKNYATKALNVTISKTAITDAFEKFVVDKIREVVQNLYEQSNTTGTAEASNLERNTDITDATEKINNNKLREAVQNFDMPSNKTSSAVASKVFRNINLTAAITDTDEKCDNNKPAKVVQNVSVAYVSTNKTSSAVASRIVRNAPSNKTEPLECLACMANGMTASDSNSCYKGTTKSKMKCRDAEHCFTELHPLYIKRGCMLQNRLNRTFFCKCPLCNNKPAHDFTYYEYASLDEWQYDNYLLEKPMGGVDIMCKICETLGTSRDADDNCRSGRNADYTVCGGNQVCYINIDEEIDHVSRGCALRPVYNTIMYFCDEKKCNNESFQTPKSIKPIEKFSLRARVAPKASGSGFQIGPRYALLLAWKINVLLRSL